MRAIWRTIYQRATNFALALILAVSTLTAVGPFILSEKASAVASAEYANTVLTGWTTDRTFPTGGYTTETFAGRSSIRLGVDASLASSNAFYKYEGIKKDIGYKHSIKADIYLDSDWLTKDVSAGIWATGKDTSDTISAYPIVAFTKSANAWRIWDSAGSGSWITSTAPYAVDTWNTLELTLNDTDDTKIDVYINGVLAGQSTTASPTDYLSEIILNNYNYGTDSYAVRWSNIQTGSYKPNAPTNLRFIKDSTSAQIANGLTVNDSNITLRWDTVANAERYQVRVTDPSGYTQSDRQTGWYTFDLNDGTRHGFFGSQQGLWTYELRTKDATTGLWSDWTTPVSLKYDSTAPTAVVQANSLALPSNTPASTTVLIPGSNPTNFTVALTDTHSDVYGAYIELFKANWDGSYGNWVKDNTNGAGNVRYGANPKLVYNTSALNGRYGLKVVSQDKTGNSATTYHFFTIDSTVPTIEIKSGLSMIEGSSENDPYRYVSFKLFDAGSNLKEVELNGHLYARGGQWNDLNWANINPAHMQQGMNTAIVRDTAGNESTITFGYDTEAPQISLVSPANGAVVKGASLTQAWSSTSSDVVKYIYRSYNDAAATSLRWQEEFSASTTSKTVANVGDATFWWEVTAVDAAGNTSTSPLWKLVVDNTAPTVALVSPTGTLFNTNVQVRGTATDSNLRHYWVKVTRNGVVVYNHTALSSGITNALLYTAVDEGEYEVTFAARDTAGGGADTGNRSADVVKTFTIDKTAPEIVIVGGDAIVHELGQPYLESGALWTDNLDTGGFVLNISGSVDVDTIGNNTITYTVTDTAGNIATATRTVTVVDTTVPVITLGTSTTVGNVITPSVTATDLSEPLTYLWTQTSGPAGGVTISDPAIASPSFTVLTDGSYTFLLTVTDAQGNDATQEFAFTYTTPEDTNTGTGGDDDDTDEGGDAFTDVTPPTQDVLGDNTDNENIQGESDVEGVSTDNTDNVAAVDTNNNDGKIFGLAWYWWLLILAALAGLGWWIAAALRRRGEQN